MSLPKTHLVFQTNSIYSVETLPVLCAMLLDKSVISPVFIGRQNDLQSLDRLMAQSHEKNGQIALIAGEAGIGKSRLVREVKARAPQGTLIVEGQCFQTDSALPYAPLLDLFRNFFATQAGEEIARLLAASGAQLVKLFPELTAVLPDLIPSRSQDPKQEKRIIFQALAQALVELAQNQPLILVIEDLHWCDSTSLEFLLLFARRIPSQRIFMLITYRAEETTPELTHFFAELDRGRLGTEFPLKRMSLPEVDAMLRTIFNLDALIRKELVDTIYPLTDGNPFFIEEILKALIAGGDIVYADGAWDRKEIGQLHIPRTIQDAVQRRTGQLDEQTLRALTLASVMGRRFDFQLLQEMLEVDERELMRMIKELIAAQLVVEESAVHFVFRHALTREAIYTTLLLRERQALHRQVGEAIERLYAGSAENYFADLSYHYFTAGEWRKALEYSHQAGKQASQLYSQREAVVYYSRALVCIRNLGIPIEPELLISRGDAYDILSDFQSAFDDLDQARAIAHEQQNRPAEWQALTHLGLLWLGRDYPKAGEYFHRAKTLAGEWHEPKLLAHSLNQMGRWYYMTGKTTQALESHRQALAFFEAEQDEVGMAETRDLLGMSMLHHGDQIGSYEEYGHAIRLLRKLDDKITLVSALIGASHSLYDETDYIPAQSRQESQEKATEALQLARQIGWASSEAFAEWDIALGLAHWGMFAEALAHAQSMFRIATEIDHPQRIIGAYNALGYIYLLMLQPDLAISNLEEGFRLAQLHGSAWLIGNITTELACAYILIGDTERAHRLLDSVLQQEEGHHTRAERRMLWAKGNLLLAENKPAEALKIAEHLLESKRAPAMTQPIPALLKLQGDASFALKQIKKAERALQRAKQGAQEREALPLLWQIQARLGWLYKEQKDAEKSEQEFAGARNVIQTLAENIPDEKLRNEFVQSASKALPTERKVSKRQSEAEKFGGLTSREREVAHLVSQGKSNREIAEALVLSERTVENHVGNILMKLGFDSRAQIAVWAVEKGLGKEKN